MRRAGLCFTRLYRHWDLQVWLEVEKETKMKFFDIPDAELEKLYDTGIGELEFSVRVLSALARAGCSTVAELAYMSVEELQGQKRMPKGVLEEVQEQLTTYHISLMTQAEKQQLLGEKDNPAVLRKQILMLKHTEQQNQNTIARLYRESNDKWEAGRKKRERALKEARGIYHTSRYPLARLLESMYFGDSACEGCRLCDILELYNEGCWLEDDASENKEIQHSCEECIEKFLADYYWEQRLQAKIAAERREAPKVLRMHMNHIYKRMDGYCPVCKRGVSYDREENFCSRCGSLLNWDEENWDKESRGEVNWDEENPEEDYQW